MPISDHVIYFPFHHGKPSRRTLMENTVLSWRKVKKLNKKIIQRNQGPYNDQNVPESSTTLRLLSWISQLIFVPVRVCMIVCV